MSRVWLLYGLIFLWLAGEARIARAAPLPDTDASALSRNLPESTLTERFFSTQMEERDAARADAYLQEMRWLTCLDHPDSGEPAEALTRNPNSSHLALKILLASPLLGKENAASLLVRPHMELLAALVKRQALSPFAHCPSITVPAGSVAVDLHVHTSNSHDSVADIRQVLRSAARRGLQGVAITDHDTFAGAQRAMTLAADMIKEGDLPAGFFVIPGEEVSAQEGHIVGLFLTTPIEPDQTAAQTIKAIHAAGGLAVAAHPCLPESLGNLAVTLPFDAVETMNGDECLTFAALSASRLRKRAAWYTVIAKPRIGGSDAHDPVVVGACYTIVSSAPNADAVREALLDGRVSPDTTLTEEELTHHIRGGGVFALCYRLSTQTQYAERGLETWLCNVTSADAAYISIGLHPKLVLVKRF